MYVRIYICMYVCALKLIVHAFGSAFEKNQMAMALGLWTVRRQETNFVKQTRYYFHIAGRDKFMTVFRRMLLRRKRDAMDKLIMVRSGGSRELMHIIFDAQGLRLMDQISYVFFSSVAAESDMAYMEGEECGGSKNTNPI